MTTTDNAISVEISAGYMSATLRIDPSADARLFTPDACVWELRNAGVLVSAEMIERIGAYVERMKQADDACQPLVFEGRPPVNGQAGRLEWMAGFDPNALGEDHDEGEEERVDFYSTRNYIDVEAGGHIATIHPPTDGQYGTDIRGEAIAPRPGQPIATRIDAATIDVDEQGRCIARCAGVLRASHREVSVSPVLQVAQNVDFNAGNIQFVGDVTIGGSVCDCFVVEAKGSVDVRGTIEAANVSAGLDLTARGGVATRGSGALVVGRDLRAKYLNNVKAAVKRDVHVEREAIQCRLIVGGRLLIPRGSLIGGGLTVQGPVHVQRLGSDGELRTELVLGCSPQTEKMIRAARARLAEIDREMAVAARELRELQAVPKPTREQRERLTELSFRPYELDGMRRDLQERLQKLEGVYARTRRVDLTVDKMIYAGVCLRIRRLCATFHDTIKGPIRIGVDRSGSPVYRAGDGPACPLANLPGVHLTTVE